MLMLIPMLMLKLMRRLMRVHVSVVHVCASASADMRARMRRHMYVPQRKYVSIMRMHVRIMRVGGIDAKGHACALICERVSVRACVCAGIYVSACS